NLNNIYKFSDSVNQITNNFKKKSSSGKFTIFLVNQEISEISTTSFHHIRMFLPNIDILQRFFKPNEWIAEMASGLSFYQCNKIKRELILNGKSSNQYYLNDKHMILNDIDKLSLDYKLNNDLTLSKTSKLYRFFPKNENNIAIVRKCLSEFGIHPNLSVSFDDIGGYTKIKDQIFRVAEYFKLTQNSSMIHRMTKPPSGILFHGPPGCSKTLFARALSNHLDKPFYILNGPTILSKYVGMAEQALREEFLKARNGILFIDEIDAIAENRDNREHTRGIVNTLLYLMDGFHNKKTENIYKE
ncbi:AAA ATPase, partial [Pseudoloma neurophilia]